MYDIKFEARDYLNYLKEKGILNLALYQEDKCIARGRALILDDQNCVAVMLEDCGDPNVTRIRGGCLVNYFRHPEAEPKIVGSPACIKD